MLESAETERRHCQHFPFTQNGTFSYSGTYYLHVEGFPFCLLFIDVEFLLTLGGGFPITVSI